jgi:hypothetical protein
MVTSYILVEGIRVGARLEGLPLELLKIERYRMPTATPQQPPVWTTVEFQFEETHVERVAAALSEVISEAGGWYTNFTHDEETFVIFANRIFRYRRGDRAGRAEVAAYGSSIGVPDAQLDWEE